MTRVIVLLLCVVASMAVLGQQGPRHGGGMHHGGRDVSMVRHRFVHANGIDSQYATKANPLESTPEILAAGRGLYEQHCAACHGMSGLGDGEAGAALSPPPANVAVASTLPMASDAYLYWTIAEGGVPIGSAMPPFKTVLGESEIWQIVVHLREL
jgi:cytochrome c553